MVKNDKNEKIIKKMVAKCTNHGIMTLQNKNTYKSYER